MSRQRDKQQNTDRSLARSAGAIVAALLLSVLAACSDWFRRTRQLLPVRVIVALGGIAWDAVWRHMQSGCGEELLPQRKPKFGHRSVVDLTSDITLVGSYHPSQQNTFTGRLTEDMLDNVFATAHELLSDRHPA